MLNELDSSPKEFTEQILENKDKIEQDNIKPFNQKDSITKLRI